LKKKKKSCANVDELLSLLVTATSNRRITPTDFIGHHSSRSHCVIIISITQRLLDDTIKTSKLNFGDLAGSELVSRTKATGNTLKEAGKIHQGLLTLENVINALVENKKYIPYKDSKLTRILMDSLGGNSKTTLLVTCSPHIWNRAESISSLRFAKRAKDIKNKARINKQLTREQLEKKISTLKEENATLKKSLKTKPNTTNDNQSKKRPVLKSQLSNLEEAQLTDFTMESNNINSKDNELKQALAEIERLKKIIEFKRSKVTTI